MNCDETNVDRGTCSVRNDEDPHTSKESRGSRSKGTLRHAAQNTTTGKINRPASIQKNKSDYGPKIDRGLPDIGRKFACRN